MCVIHGASGSCFLLSFCPSGVGWEYGGSGKFLSNGTHILSLRNLWRVTSHPGSHLDNWHPGLLGPGVSTWQPLSFREWPTSQRGHLPPCSLPCILWWVEGEELKSGGHSFEASGTQARFLPSKDSHKNKKSRSVPTSGSWVSCLLVRQMGRKERPQGVSLPCRSPRAPLAATCLCVQQSWPVKS